MPKRTIRAGKMVSTYKCGNGWFTEMIGKYGELVDSTFSFTQQEANRAHKRMVEGA